jgi:alpha-galactosidase/6-phospho-beta-glucosidase family protein
MSSREAVSIEEVDVLASEKDGSKKPGRPIKDIEEGRRINVSIAMSPKVLNRITEKADETDISRSDLVNKMLAAYMDGITFDNYREFEAALDHWLDKKRKEAEEQKVKHKAEPKNRAETKAEEEEKTTRSRKRTEEEEKPEIEEESPKLEAKEDEGFLSDLLGL